CKGVGDVLLTFDTRTGQRLWQSPPARYGVNICGTPVFSPDGAWIAVMGAGCPPRVWQSRTGEGGHSLFGHEGTGFLVTSLRFTPDSRFLFTTGTDRTVRQWDPVTGQQIHVYRGHTGGVIDHTFTPSGRLLVSV